MADHGRLAEVKAQAARGHRLAPQLREGEQLRVPREVLVANDQHLVLPECGVEFVEHGTVDWPD